MLGLLIYLSFGYWEILAGSQHVSLFTQSGVGLPLLLTVDSFVDTHLLIHSSCVVLPLMWTASVP